MMRSYALRGSRYVIRDFFGSRLQSTKSALSYSGVVSVSRWLKFNGSKKQLMGGFVSKNRIGASTKASIVRTLREHVKKATPPIPASLSLEVRDYSIVDEAHQRADGLFHSLVVARELQEEHCNTMADLAYSLDDIRRIKTYMKILNIPISEKVYRTEIDLMTIFNIPHEDLVNELEDEFHANLSKRTRKIMQNDQHALMKRRANRLKLWLCRGTEAREAAWDLFNTLIKLDLVTTEMFKVMALYGCDFARDIQNNLVAKLGDDDEEEESQKNLKEVFGVLSYRYRVEADTLFSTEYDPIVSKLDRQYTQTSSWEHEHRTLHLQHLLTRDFQSAWFLFCTFISLIHSLFFFLSLSHAHTHTYAGTLEVRRALNIELCTNMISACYDEDEMRRRVLKSVHSETQRMKVLEAMVEQNLILGDVQSAKQLAQQALNSNDIFERAVRGDLIATTYGDLGTPLLTRRVNALRRWSLCGGDRGQVAVSTLFKRILSLERGHHHSTEKAWIFNAVIERMVESGQWDHAEELLESAISRGDLRNPVTQGDNNVVTLSLGDLNRSTAIVAVRRELLRADSNLKIIFDSKKANKSKSDLVLKQISKLEERLTVMRATGGVDERSDWLIYQILEAVRNCRRPNNTVMVTDVMSYMNGSDAMLRILERHGTLRKFLERYPDLFRTERRDVEILRVNYDAAEPATNSEMQNKAIFSVLRSVRQSRGPHRRHVLYGDVIRELKSTQSPRLVKYIKDRYQTLRVFLKRHRAYFDLRKKRGEHFLLLNGEVEEEHNDEITFPGDDEWYILRASVLGSLRSIGIERIRQSSEGRIMEIGINEIQKCREKFES
jgi:hypothetical protein